MDEQSAISVKELRKSLECPVCFHTPKAGPLYQCENGHILCSGCNGKVQQCPECRVNLPNVRMRNLFAEKQLEKLPKQCKYSDNGCNFEKMPSEKQVLDNHEKECQHRAFACPILSCAQTVPLSRHSSHVKDHNVGLSIISLKNISFGNYIPILHENLEHRIRQYFIHFTFEEKHFYLEIVRMPVGWPHSVDLLPNGNYYIWVYVIGSSKEEENFTYTFTVFHSTNKSQSKSCKGNVISIDTPWKTICSEESALAGLILSDAVIKQFTHSLGDASKKNSGPPFFVKIESNKNSSTKRKRTED